MVEYAGGDRRPIKSRELRLFQRLAGTLARAGVSANAISVLGMVFGMAAGGLLIATDWNRDALIGRLLFAGAAGAIQLRLLANMLDGMVALESGKASAVGELYNELPDRISDTAILVGAGYAAGGSPALGWAAACMALFVTYIRSVGKGMGVMGLFQGPMAKSHRMFLLTLACGVMVVMPSGEGLSVGTIRVGLMDAALLVVIAGGAWTALRRLAALVGALKTPSSGGQDGGGRERP